MSKTQFSRRRADLSDIVHASSRVISYHARGKRSFNVGGLEKVLLGVIKNLGGTWVGLADTWYDYELGMNGVRYDGIDSRYLGEASHTHKDKPDNSLARGKRWASLRKWLIDHQLGYLGDEGDAHSDFVAFERANQVYVDYLAANVPANGTVIFHDNGLLLASGMLKMVRPDISVGYMQHGAWGPASEFAKLPEYQRVAVLMSLKTADSVIVQSAVHARHLWNAFRQEDIDPPKIWLAQAQFDPYDLEAEANREEVGEYVAEFDVEIGNRPIFGFVGRGDDAKNDALGVYTAYLALLDWWELELQDPLYDRLSAEQKMDLVPALIVADKPSRLANPGEPLTEYDHYWNAANEVKERCAAHKLGKVKTIDGGNRDQTVALLVLADSVVMGTYPDAGNDIPNQEQLAVAQSKFRPKGRPDPLPISSMGAPGHAWTQRLLRWAAGISVAAPEFSRFNGDLYAAQRYFGRTGLFRAMLQLQRMPAAERTSRSLAGQAAVFLQASQKWGRNLLATLPAFRADLRAVEGVGVRRFMHLPTPDFALVQHDASAAVLWEPPSTPEAGVATPAVEFNGSLKTSRDSGTTGVSVATTCNLSAQSRVELDTALRAQAPQLARAAAAVAQSHPLHVMVQETFDSSGNGDVRAISDWVFENGSELLEGMSPRENLRFRPYGFVVAGNEVRMLVRPESPEFSHLRVASNRAGVTVRDAMSGNATRYLAPQPYVTVAVLNNPSEAIEVEQRLQEIDLDALPALESNRTALVVGATRSPLGEPARIVSVNNSPESTVMNVATSPVVRADGRGIEHEGRSKALGLAEAAAP